MYYPLVISFLLVTIILLFDKHIFTKLIASSFFDSTLIVFSVLLGFLLTVSTLMHTIENDIIRIFKKTNQYEKLMKFLAKSIYSSFVVTFLSLLLPLYKVSYLAIYLSQYELTVFLKTIIIWIVLYSSLLIFRFIRWFLKVII